MWFLISKHDNNPNSKKKTCAHLRISEKIGFPHVCFYKHSIPLISRSILLCWWGPPPDRPIFRPRHALRLLAGKRQGKGRIQESFNHYPQVSPLKMVNEWEYWWDVYIYITYHFHQTWLAGKRIELLVGVPLQRLITTGWETCTICIEW